MTIADEGEVDEKFIEDILEKNLWIIEKGLKLVKRQRNTKIGPIDILARDKNDKYVIIEIKKNHAEASALGQVIGYMAALKKELKVSRKMIRGIIFCKKASKKIQFASDFVQGLSYVEYSWINHENNENMHIANLSDEELNLIKMMRNSEWSTVIGRMKYLQRIDDKAMSV